MYNLSHPMIRDGWAEPDTCWMNERTMSLKEKLLDLWRCLPWLDDDMKLTLTFRFVDRFIYIYSLV